SQRKSCQRRTHFHRRSRFAPPNPGERLEWSTDQIRSWYPDAEWLKQPDQHDDCGRYFAGRLVRSDSGWDRRDGERWAFEPEPHDLQPGGPQFRRVRDGWSFASDCPFARGEWLARNWQFADRES